MLPAAPYNIVIRIHHSLRLGENWPRPVDGGDAAASDSSVWVGELIIISFLIQANLYFSFGQMWTLTAPDGAAAQLSPKGKKASCSTMNGALPEPNLNCFAAVSKVLAG